MLRRSPVPLNLNPFSRRRERARPFLILALARSGSSTLRRSLACHSAVSCVHEPFNPGRRAPQEGVADRVVLRRELGELRKRYSGIKHVWDMTGWPFPNGSSLNQELATQRGQRILFLNRRNVLRRLVSQQISAQTDAWGTEDADRKAVREFPLMPLDTEALEYFLIRERSAILQMRRAIVASGNPFRDLWYEDLFEPHVSTDTQEAILAGVFEFLGVDPALPAERRERMRRLLRPEDGPLNSPATYRRVPGIDAIEARFGSDSTGYLFRPQR